MKKTKLGQYRRYQSLDSLIITLTYPCTGLEAIFSDFTTLVESVTTTKSQPDLNAHVPPSYSESLVLTGHVAQPSPTHKLSGSLIHRAGANVDGDKFLSEQALQHLQLQQPKSNESSLRVRDFML